MFCLRSWPKASHGLASKVNFDEILILVLFRVLEKRFDFFLAVMASENRIAPANFLHPSWIRDRKTNDPPVAFLSLSL